MTHGINNESIKTVVMPVFIMFKMPQDIKRNEVLIYSTTWMNLEISINEISHTQKNKYCMIPFI